MIEYPTSNRKPDKLARVLDSRPQLKGRDINTLAPDGKYGEWVQMKQQS